MFGLAKKFFVPKANPIGVDFGSDALRLAQVRYEEGDYRLIAAASADVPSHVRNDPSAKLAFFVQTTRDLLAQGNFVGRQAVLSLPASMMFIQHLRMAKMDEQSTLKALPWEAQGKLPIDPSLALMRHIVAGEVYADSEPKQEIIFMAASREAVNQLLGAAGRAKLDVVGMNIEAKAVVDCFGHIYRRKTDQEVTNCFVDIGCTATRVFVARGEQILLARSIPVGGDHLTRAVAEGMGMKFEEARMLRIKLAAVQASHVEAPVKVAVREEASEENSFALLSAGLRAGEGQQRRVEDGLNDRMGGVALADAEVEDRGMADVMGQGPAVERACEPVTGKLVEELDLCRRYYETTFPSGGVDRLIFVGGEARQRAMCQRIARELGLAAQVGDPLVRMGRTSDVGIESGIDRRQAQPSWAVAIGLSLGPVGVRNEVRV
ncbi:MAG: pilus assembly protein PilM [Phycisphaerales bacterium]|nr:pilus assembly protein PilM [Phycisphaerales bacterium]